MSETVLPAAEAEAVGTSEIEVYAYELAFHILPTVAEGEVHSVFEEIKTRITTQGGVIFDEEAPLRFELAYEMVKQFEGKNRTYASAYFGWVRFKASSSTIALVQEDIEGHPSVLRHILIKLSRTEEEHPFRFHDAIERYKMVTTIDEEDLVVEEGNGEEGIVDDTVAVEKEVVETVV